MTDVVVPPPAAPAGKSGLWLALRVLDEPTTVFRELAVRPRALVPLGLLVLVAAAVAFGAPTRVLRNASEAQLEALEENRPGSIPPDIRERALQRAGSPLARIMVFGSQCLTALLMLAVVSAVLAPIFNAMGSGAIRFRDEWSIAWHAYVPQIVGLVVTWLGVTLTDDMGFRVGLGFLVPEDASRFGHVLAQQFTVFGAWNIYLLALGNQVRTKAAGIGGALAIVGTLWVITNIGWALVSTALGGMM